MCKMKDKPADAQEDRLGKEDSSRCLSYNGAFLGDHGSDYAKATTKRMVGRVNSEHTVISKAKRLQRSKSCVKYSFLRSILALDSWIPRPMVTVDEKYLHNCLEVIHISALKVAPCDVSLNSGWGGVNVLSNVFNPAKIENTSDLARLCFDHPFAADTGSVVMSPAGQWIVGSVMGSKSMVNILNSPLSRNYGSYDGHSNLGEVTFNNVKGSIRYDLMSSPGGLSSNSSHKLDKEALIHENHRRGSKVLNERVICVSSTNSTCSDQSSLSPAVAQGMLRCSFKGKNPHFVFSLDDQKLLYVANLWKVDSADDTGLDYVYLIHSRTGDWKDPHEVESNLVGKMKVSTTFTLCPNNCRIMEREFVLFGSNETFVGEMQSSSHEVKKYKRLSKKVVNLFRTGHLMKKKTVSRFGVSSATKDISSWEPLQDADNEIDAHGPINLLENVLPPNIELAAIVVRDHLPDNRPENVGGWGLNFLKKAGLKQIDETSESLIPSTACCDRDNADCSTSIDVILPAGLHGGPRTRNNGPSSLLERWRSGGSCDCCGWDLGCPLTVLKRCYRNKELSSQSEVQEECKPFDLFLQGSENGPPPLRMVNVYDGLYFVHYQSTLSALQSFSIAVAYIHAQSPCLQPKNVQELK